MKTMTHDHSNQGSIRNLLAAQFFGAFNDNALKLMVAFLAFRSLQSQYLGNEIELQRLFQFETTLAFCVLTLPLILVSLPAGVLADRLSKRTIIVTMKGAEIGLMAAVTALLWLFPDNIRLPLEPGEPVEPVGEPFFGFYSDRSIDAPNVDRALVRADKKSRRQFCGESDPVFGDMVALLDYPFKLIWYERYPPELYDLSWDPLEKSNLASQQPERVERLAAAAEAFARAAGLADFASSDAPELPAEAVEALRALGYAD